MDIKTIMNMGDREIIEWLQAEELLKRNVQCIACGSFLILADLADRPDKVGWRCLSHDCAKRNHSVSVRTQSFFSGSKLSLKYQLLLALFWAQNIRNNQITRILGLSKTTVTKFFKKFRNLTSLHFQMQPIKLGGPGNIVEIDESAFSRKAKFHRGSALHKKTLWVFGAVAQDGMGFMQVVPNRTRATLEPIISDIISAGSVIHSDCWKAYNNIAVIPNKNYTHRTVNHSDKRNPFKNPVTGVHTNRIEGYWSKHKMNLKAMYGIPKDLLPSYIHEFLYKERIPHGVNKFQAVCDLIKNTYV